MEYLPGHLLKPSQSTFVAQKVEACDVREKKKEGQQFSVRINLNELVMKSERNSPTQMRRSRASEVNGLMIAGGSMLVSVARGIRVGRQDWQHYIGPRLAEQW